MNRITSLHRRRDASYLAAAVALCTAFCNCRALAPDSNPTATVTCDNNAVFMEFASQTPGVYPCSTTATLGDVFTNAGSGKPLGARIANLGPKIVSTITTPPQSRELSISNASTLKFSTGIEKSVEAKLRIAASTSLAFEVHDQTYEYFNTLSGIGLALDTCRGVQACMGPSQLSGQGNDVFVVVGSYRAKSVSLQNRNGSSGSSDLVTVAIDTGSFSLRNECNSTQALQGAQAIVVENYVWSTATNHYLLNRPNGQTVPTVPCPKGCP